MTKDLETIEDLESFSHSISYGLHSGDLPNNVTIRVDLSPEKFNKLLNEIRIFTLSISLEPQFTKVDFFIYYTFGINFYIYKKSE